MIFVVLLYIYDHSVTFMYHSAIKHDLSIARFLSLINQGVFCTVIGKIWDLYLAIFFDFYSVFFSFPHSLKFSFTVKMVENHG